MAFTSSWSPRWRLRLFLVVLSNPKTPKYSVYNIIKHRKAANPHILKARTRECWLSTNLFSSTFPVRICRSLVVAVNTFTSQCWNHLSTISLRVYCRSSECLNGFSAGWQYSGCVQPLFWSGNVVSVGIWPDHSHNSHWEEGRFALL